jgi:hypothetical protein
LKTSENPTLNRRLGDLITRAGRGVEMWNGLAAPDGSWIPITVNRYADQTALNGVPSESKNLGTLAWVVSEKALKVWAGDTDGWKVVYQVP